MMECYDGTISLPLGQGPDLEVSGFLPSATCHPKEGICFSALTHSQGAQVATFGCWPRQSQSGDSLAWYGVPECKNEVRSLFKILIEVEHADIYVNLVFSV